MALLRLSLQEMYRRPARTLLTLASIVLAVASIVAVWIGTSSARRAYALVSAPPGGVEQYEIVDRDGGKIPLDQTDALYEQLPVRLIAIAQGQGAIRVQGKKLRTIISGVDLVEGGDSAYWKLVKGDWQAENMEGTPVWLEEEIAASLEAKPGEQVLLFTRRGVERLTCAGVFHNLSLMSLQNASVVLTLEDHQAIFGGGENIDLLRLEIPAQIEAAATKGGPEQTDHEPVPGDSANKPASAVAAVPPAEKLLTAADVLQKIRQLIPESWELRKPVRLGEMGDQSLKAVSSGMDFIMALSLGMAGFMILNAFLMNVSERRKQLAILRAIGATRSQILRVMLSEGFLLGVFGSLIGVPLGVWGASFLSATLQNISQMQPQLVPLDWTGLVIGALAGPLVALLGAYLPARSASQIHPAEGLSANPVDQPDQIPLRHAITAALIFGVCGLVIVLVIQRQLPHFWSIPSGLGMIVAFLYMVPVIIKPLLGGLSRLLWVGGDVEKNLARQQLLRRHTRTVLTVGVLIVAVNSGIGSGNTIITHLNDVQDWYARALPGDYSLRTLHGIENAAALSTPEATIASDLRANPLVQKVETMQFARGRAAELPVTAIVRSKEPGAKFPLDVAPSDEQAVAAKFEAGEVITSAVFAHRANVAIGDEITVELNNKKSRLRIAALTRDYNPGGMTLYFSDQVAREQFDLQDIDMYLVTAKPGQAEALGISLAPFAKEQSLTLKSFNEMKQVLDNILTGIQGAYWLLLVMGFVVAAFGIVNTMTMNILEQTHEIGLLRIIGMTRGQIRNLFMIQAALIGMSSALIGGFAGVVTAYIMQRTSEPILGYSVPFSLHWPLLIWSCLLAVIIGVVAAIWPIRHAVRLELATALASE
ncbi:MAG: FtsX-like permease family protein [Pirellulales bacterium]|nr:FtsX-like permease family protein [Pirellulales bacterium]